MFPIKPIPQGPPTEPFFVIPLEEVVRPLVVITQGRFYTPEECAWHPAIALHNALDWQVPRDTKVLMPCNGWVMASSHLGHYEDGPRGLIEFSLGDFTQVLEEETGCFHIFGHLNGFNWANVAWERPHFEEGKWKPQGIYCSKEEFRERAKYVRRGEVIGYAGDSGLAFNWPYEQEPGKARRDPEKYPSWDPAGVHIHHETFWDRIEGDDGKPYGKKSGFFDPTGINGFAPEYVKVLNSPASGLMFADPETGLPAFADYKAI